VQNVRRSKQRLDTGQARFVGLLGFAAAVALPLLLWRGVAATLANRYSPSPGYFLTAWTPFALMALGLLLFVPVFRSIGLRSYARGYARRRNAYAGWGVTLYLLGVALASQVAAIARGLGTP
jgi:hypothetical protein